MRLLVTGAINVSGDKGECVAHWILGAQILAAISIQQVMWHIHDSVADLAAEQIDVEGYAERTLLIRLSHPRVNIYTLSRSQG